MSDNMLDTKAKALIKDKPNGKKLKTLEEATIRGIKVPIREGSTLTECMSGYFSITNPEGELYFIRISPTLVKGIKTEPIA